MPKYSNSRRKGSPKKGAKLCIIKSRKEVYLSPYQLKALEYIEKNKGYKTFKEVAESIGCNPFVVSEAVKKLKKAEHPLVLINQNKAKSNRVALGKKELQGIRKMERFLLKQGRRSEYFTLRYGTEKEKEEIIRRIKDDAL